MVGFKAREQGDRPQPALPDCVANSAPYLVSLCAAELIISHRPLSGILFTWLQSRSESPGDTPVTLSGDSWIYFALLIYIKRGMPQFH